MASKPFFSEREVRLARSFIKAIHGNPNNGYLLLAVIAWQRAMTKSHDAFFKSLSKYSSTVAGSKLAAKLVARANLDSKHYVGVLKSLRNTPKEAGYASQARDFILAISQSKWDKNHYGYKPYVEGHWETKMVYNPQYGEPTPQQVWVPTQEEVNPLEQSWAKLTGHNIPKAYFVDAAGSTTTVTPPPPPPKPRQPRSLVHVLPEPDYIRPYGAANFYSGRPHLGDPRNILPD